jgi:hypothetical protein
MLTCLGMDTVFGDYILNVPSEYLQDLEFIYIAKSLSTSSLLLDPSEWHAGCDVDFREVTVLPRPRTNRSHYSALHSEFPS